MGVGLGSGQEGGFGGMLKGIPPYRLLRKGAAIVVTNLRAKVFWFFFSRKNCFLAFFSVWRRSFVVGAWDGGLRAFDGRAGGAACVGRFAHPTALRRDGHGPEEDALLGVQAVFGFVEDN